MKSFGIFLAVIVAGLAAYIIYGMVTGGGTAYASSGSGGIRSTSASNAKPGIAPSMYEKVVSDSRGLFAAGDSSYKQITGTPVKVQTTASGTYAKAFGYRKRIA